MTHPRACLGLAGAQQHPYPLPDQGKKTNSYQAEAAVGEESSQDIILGTRTEFFHGHFFQVKASFLPETCRSRLAAGGQHSPPHTAPTLQETGASSCHTTSSS